MKTISSVVDAPGDFNSHSNPFIGCDNLGGVWFVKTYSTKFGSDLKALFNEYVAFHLAKKIDLPWPTGEVVLLSEDVKSELDISLSNVIAYEFIYDIDCLPEDYRFNDIQMDALYGKSVFDNWLSIGDAKTDTCKLTNGSLIFMDAGISSGVGSDNPWEEDELIWKPARLMTESSPYHRGNLSSPDGFEPWLDKICKINIDYYQDIINDLPSEWNVPESYKTKFVEVFSSSHIEFIKLMRECINAELGYEL